MTINKFVLGIDIGGTNYRLGLVDNNGVINKFVIRSSSMFITHESSLLKLIESIKEYLLENLDGKLIGIGLGLPSTITKDRKIVLSTPNIPQFNNVNIVKPLEQEFNVPVYLNTDVNNLLLFDLIQKRIVDKEIVLGFYIGTGFGNSIYINNNFLDGKNGVAGELGHIPVLNSKKVCSCGNEGCIEIYASGKRLSEIKDENFKDTDISDIFIKHGNGPLIKEFINALSIPIATEINIFDPDCIIIGGGVIQMPSFPIEELEKNIFKYARKPYPAKELEIVYSDQDQKSGVIGAAYYVFKNLKYV